MSSNSDLTDQEKAFCWAYIHSDGADPAASYLATIDADAPRDESLQQKVTALLERNEIRLELYYLSRLRSETSQGSLLAELEQARRIAVAHGDGSTAAMITCRKAVLLGHVVVHQPAAEPDWIDPDQPSDMVPRETLH
jgi:hypothetical protein